MTVSIERSRMTLRCPGGSKGGAILEDVVESLIAFVVGSLAILLSRRWINDTREGLENPEALSGYKLVYAPLTKGRGGEILLWVVRIVGALLVIVGVTGFFHLITGRPVPGGG